MALGQSINSLTVSAKSTTGKIESHIVTKILSREPNPLFSHHRVPINNFHLNSSTILGNTVTPPRGPIDDKGTFIFN